MNSTLTNQTTKTAQTPAASNEETALGQILSVLSTRKAMETKEVTDEANFQFRTGFPANYVIQLLGKLVRENKVVSVAGKVKGKKAWKRIG